MSPAGGAARLTGALTAPLWDGGRRAAAAEAAEALAEAEEIALTQALLEADAQAEQARLRIAELGMALDGRRAVVAVAEDEAALARALPFRPGRLHRSHAGRSAARGRPSGRGARRSGAG